MLSNVMCVAKVVGCSYLSLLYSHVVLTGHAHGGGWELLTIWLSTMKLLHSHSDWTKSSAVDFSSLILCI